MKNVIEYIKANGGYARTRELRAAGFHTRDIKSSVESGDIEKVKSGLYKVASAINGEKINPGFIDICKAFPKSVICLISAAEFHGLSSANPPLIYAAIPKSEKPPRIEYPPVKFYYWEETIYNPGIKKIKTENGIVKIYDKEKTVCDLFRYREKLGEDIAIEALKNYLSDNDFNLNKLRKYAVETRIKGIITPYIKAIVG